MMIVVEKLFSSKERFKFKYSPLNLKYDDLLLWLEKGNMPDTLYLKGAKKEFVKIEIQFSVIGKNGPFGDKSILLDNNELALDDIKNKLKELIYLEEQQCLLMGYTENNDPNLFLKVIEELKN